MLNLLANGLVIAGICILAAALLPVRRLIAQLPAGQVRRRWYALTGLISVFIVGYLGYAIAFWNRPAVWIDLIVPGVFFFGAAFVWLTASLSLQTATDIRRVTQLERENITDGLLGIYNRRYWDRRLEEECARARRYALPMSVLLIDIDHFKHINDTYGHPVGDLVLSSLGKWIRQAVRECDIVARYGGEEIAILAPNTALSSAAVLAERLRRLVETRQLVVTNGSNQSRVVRITVSIGVAGLSQEAAEGQRLVQDADKALYRAKEAGRNRVVIHEANRS